MSTEPHNPALPPTSGPSDAELITRTRGGDTDAYGELYQRHAQAARRLAYTLVRGSNDADDLVAEAFAKVLAQLRGGHGPDLAFRAYLLTSMRNVFHDRLRRDKRLSLTDDLSQYDRGVPFVDTATDKLEQSLAARAFAKLPERWQTVLWHTEVEGESAAQVAPLLGLSPNGVSALAYRARERLRQMYLQEHINDTADVNCQWTAERLGARVREGLSPREQARVDAHLKQCQRCRLLYVELAEVNSGLRGVIAPVVVGTTWAAYLGLGAAPKGALAGAGLLPWWHQVTGWVASGWHAATGAAVAGWHAVTGAAVAGWHAVAGALTPGGQTAAGAVGSGWHAVSGGVAAGGHAALGGAKHAVTKLGVRNVVVGGGLGATALVVAVAFALSPPERGIHEVAPPPPGATRGPTTGAPGNPAPGASRPTPAPSTTPAPGGSGNATPSSTAAQPPDAPGGESGSTPPTTSPPPEPPVELSGYIVIPPAAGATLSAGGLARVSIGIQRRASGALVPDRYNDWPGGGSLVLSVRLPSGVQLASVSGSQGWLCLQQLGGARCTHGAIAPGETTTTTLLLFVHSTVHGSVSFSATISAGGESASATFRVPVSPPAHQLASPLDRRTGVRSSAWRKWPWFRHWSSHRRHGRAQPVW